MYLALYRKYRPNTFDKVVGQEHITTTLLNQLKNGSIGHAYLFTGTRGTGKTSVAKIFARAVNCAGEGVKPCGNCPACIETNNIDILEIDAASNNKVEEVRDLREKVKYPPLNSKYKVYIIDEVHMLTESAFNALLKTLEEPPSYVIFILATTEAHKLPATILSRCMRFDFRLVGTDVLASLITKIYQENGKLATPDAINLIAKSGAGSVRDALSIADMCMSFSEGELTYDQVLEVIGATGQERIKDLCRYIFEGDCGNILSVIDELARLGKSMSLLNSELISYMRDAGVTKTVQDPNKILLLPKDRLQALVGVAAKATAAEIIQCIDILSAAGQDLRYGLNPEVILETACIKCAITLDREGVPKPITSTMKTKKEETSTTEKEDKKTKTIEKTAKVEVKESIVKPTEEPKQEVKEETFEEDLIPPLENNNQGFFADSNTSPKEATTKDKPQQKQEKVNVSIKPANLENAEALQGALVRSLRKAEELMLYSTLTEATVSTQGNILHIKTKDEYDMRVLEGKVLTILEHLPEGIDVKISMQDNEDDSQQTIARLEELSGGKLEIKE